MWFSLDVEICGEDVYTQRPAKLILLMEKGTSLYSTVLRLMPHKAEHGLKRTSLMFMRIVNALILMWQFLL